MTFALDTNIISYMLKRDNNVCEKYLAESDNGHECIIPPVAYYEIRRGLLAINATAKTREFEILCQEFGVGEMNTSAWDKAAQLYAERRRNGRQIEDADLFIAAFCIVNGYTLVTHNIRHFDGIDGLTIVDWTE